MEGKVIEYINEHGDKKILRIMNKLGEGGYGVVHKALLDAFGEVAVKLQTKISRSGVISSLLELKKAPELEKHSLALRKIIVTPSLKETYPILDIPEVSVTRSYVGDNQIIFIYDLAVGMELYKVIETQVESEVPFTFETIKRYASQLLKGVIEMRKAGVVHRDIKPENVMLHNGKLKYIDYGMICEPVGENKCQKRKGTLFFMSPKVYDAQHRDLTEKEWYDGDLYAVGITIMNLCGEIPFENGEDPREVFEENDYAESYKIIQEMIKEILFENNHTAFIDVVTGLTSIDPITPEEALEMLKEVEDNRE